MARKRREYMTSIDYVVIALSPALIMLLVGSLCFFLLEVFYRGQYESRLTWIMFWFVFAIVLIARIAIEEGAERASVYGLGLAGAVGVAMLRFVDSPFIAWGLMALTWWCAHKLTWDCTLVDDDQDASGEGLLQIAGLDDGAATTGKPTPSTGEPEASASGYHQGADAPRSPDDAGDKPPAAKNFWQRLIESPEERRRRPHAPGLWVVYFSLAALPLFGLGQAFVPAGDVVRRRYVFWLLMAYVASALGLLLTTSFLGLRRYLRQRRLQMPLAMTGAWLTVGAALIFGLLTLALLVPRPSPEYPVEEMIAGALGSPTRKASKYAVLKDSATQGEGKAGESAGQGQQGQGQQGQGQQGQGQQGQGQQGQGQQGQGQQGQGQQGQGQQGQGQQGQGQQGQGQQGQGQQGQGQQGQGQQGQGQQGQGQQGQGQQGQGQQGQGQQGQGQQGQGQQGQGQQGQGQQGQGQQGQGQQGQGQQGQGQQGQGQQGQGQQGQGQQGQGQQGQGQQGQGQQGQGQQGQGQQGQGQQGQGQQGQGQQGQGQQGQGQQGQGQQGQGQQGQGQQGQGQQGQGQQGQKRAEQGQDQGRNEQERGQRSSEQGQSGSSQQQKPQERTTDRNSSKPSSSQPQSSAAAPSNPPPTTPRLPSLSSVPLASWIRWLMYGAMLAAAIYGFLKFRRQVLAFLRQLLEELKNILSGLFGRRRAAAAEDTALEPAPPPRPFAAFKDPFLSGAAGRSSADQLVRYTFDAVQAWAFERGSPRPADATPLEFSQQLGAQAPQLAAEVRELAQLYSQITYARGSLSPACLPMLRRLWERLRSSSRPAQTAATS